MKATTTILIMEDPLEGSTILHEAPQKEDRHTSDTNEGSLQSDSISKLELMVLGSDETKKESLQTASEDQTTEYAVNESYSSAQDACGNCSDSDGFIEFKGISTCLNCGAAYIQTDGTVKIQAVKPKQEWLQTEISPIEVASALMEEELEAYTNRTRVPLSEQSIQMRGKLLDLILTLSEKTKQRDLTKHFAIAYLDEIFRRLVDGAGAVPNLLGANNPKNETVLPPLCLLLGSKFDEIDSNIPQINSLLRTYNRSVRFQSFSRSNSGSRGGNSTNNWNSISLALTFEDIVNAEKSLLSMMNWELLKVIPLSFLQCYLSQGIVFTTDLTLEGAEMNEITISKVYKDAYKFCDKISYPLLKIKYIYAAMFLYIRTLISSPISLPR